MDAFWELSRSRPQGEAFGHIPQTQYLAWFDTWYVKDLEDRDRHFRIIGRLDAVFVEMVQKKRKAELESAKNQSTGKGSVSRP